MNLSFLTLKENTSCPHTFLQSETYIMIIVSNDIPFTSTHSNVTAGFSMSPYNTFEAPQKSLTIHLTQTLGCFINRLDNQFYQDISCRMSNDFINLIQKIQKEIES